MFGCSQCWVALVALLAKTLVAFATTQTADLTENSQCQRLLSCGACIVALSGRCAWCADLNYTAGEQWSTRPRCQLFKVLQSSCVNVINPESRAVQAPNTLKTSSSQLLSPQQYDIVLRPGKPVQLDIDVFRSDSYPVDLYYLMDLTHTMKDDLDVIKELSKSIDTWMQGLTNDYRLGFGSFIDKPVLPFTVIAGFREYCPVETCQDLPYGFINWRSLTPDSAKFRAEVERLNISRSLDSPEGGLDALLQVAVCKDKIGWRDNAHHLVVMVTDALSHLGGEGKLAGLYRPNDGACHLVSRGDGTMEYDYSLKQDFPTPSHLAAVMREHEILPIFAVARYADVYQAMVQSHFRQVRGQVGHLQRNSRNIEDLIASSYYSIVSSASLELDASQLPPALHWESSAKMCPGQIVGNSCTNLTFNQTAQLTLTLSLSDCSALTREKLKNGLTVRVPAFGSVRLNISLLCECDCEKQAVKHSTYCSSGSGALTCGACDCNKGRFGPTCQCAKDDLSPKEDICRLGPISDGTCCETAADCNCGGMCQKDSRVQTEACNISASGVCIPKVCPKNSDGLECSGHGWCVCAKCVCPPGYTGPSCNDLCPLRTDTCQSRSAHGICNGRGQCSCGRCECDRDYVRDKDKMCICDVTDTSSSCQPTCSMVNSSCIFCQLFNTGPKAGQSCSECTVGGTVTYFRYVNDAYRAAQMAQLSTEQGSSLTWIKQQCTGDIEVDECELKYFTATDDRGDLRIVLARQECPSSADATWIIIAVIAGTVVAGILFLILWKIVTTLQMRREQEREFKRFQVELMMSKTNQTSSPLYEPPKMEYQNPIYRTQQGKEDSASARGKANSATSARGRANSATSVCGRANIATSS